MYIGELTQLRQSNISRLRSSLNACLSTYKYLLAVAIALFLLGSYFIQRHMVSAYQVSTLLTISKGADSVLTDNELQKQAGHIKSDTLISQVINAPAFKSAYVHEGTLASWIKRYKRGLKITVVNKPNTLLIQLKDQTQDRAQAFLNFLIGQYQLNIIDNNAAGNNIKWIDDSLKVLHSNLSLLRRSTAGPTLIVRTLKKPAVAWQTRQEYKRQANVLGVILSYLSKPVSTFVVVPDNFLPDTDQLQPLIKQYNNLQQRRQSILSNEPFTHTTTAKLIDQQMIALQLQAKQHIASQKTFILRKLNMPAIGQLQTSNPSTGRTSAAEKLQRRIDLLNNLKSDTKISQLRSAPQVSATNYTIKPIHPHSLTAYASAVLLGIAASAAAIYTSQKLSKKINNITDIQRHTDITIAGELEDTSADYSGEQPCSRPSQIGISLLLERYMIARRRLVLVTSNMSGEGKGYFSISLANELVASGKKVVLIDYTIEGPSLLEKLDVTYNKGINDFLSHDEITIADLIMPSPDCDNLYFIGAGVAWEHLKLELKSFLNQLSMASYPDPDQPDEHQQNCNAKLTTLIEELMRQFDYIIMYVPDIDTRTDSSCLAMLSGLTICLVRYNYTLKEQVATLNNLKKSGNLKNAVIIINHLLKCDLPTLGTRR